MQILTTLEITEIDPTIVNRSLEVFFKSLNDYAIDKRGDVGSWVREQGMHCLDFFFSSIYGKMTLEERARIIPIEEEDQLYVRFID